MTNDIDAKLIQTIDAEIARLKGIKESILGGPTLNVAALDREVASIRKAAAKPTRKRARKAAAKTVSDVRGKITAALTSSKTPLRAEAIAAAVGVKGRELTRELKALVADKAIKRKGAARATTYSAG